MIAGRCSPDVVVIGAGVAGLACAQDLLAAGVDVQVLEASDGVGGRMRSDRVDGFVVDRGFQVFNTFYPQVRRRLALPAPTLRPFTPGVLIHTEDGRRRLTVPVSHPSAFVDLLSGRVAGPRDLAALGVLAASDALLPPRRLKRRSDHTTRAALARAGFTDAFVERFFRPFLSGVFLEDRLETSARVFHLVWRSMLRGALCLPDGGIGAVPCALAAALPQGVVRLRTPVERLTDDGVETAARESVPARAVVVATGPGAAVGLVPDVTVPAYRVVTTYYHAPAEAPLREPTLLVDTRRRFLNTCVPSEVAASYAPPGRALVATSVLGSDATGREHAVREALSEVYAADAARWDLLAVRTVPEALPAMAAPQELTRTTRVAPGRYVCGDHRATGSVQGAMASGARAAREVLRDLRRR
ncbi:FAD-dependent oxidoreductase [Streptomyces sp. IBSBF 2953]|uniref:NAD(P)/FAD-dependent oxidoreductase n=1 Tax=Streptomyces TaxID=1883 RepID=UPI00211A97DF|nr:NAD(P)/FAD-dependent oxidoreductase [Streptomyces scabiei]MCQ9182228.1 FAD-dependent oxidoreductase [Streptomyces hayashii]MDX3113320.1 NAD(P)/FAD-dependent oxidoreductase [Streptomyces scabiei]